MGAGSASVSSSAAASAPAAPAQPIKGPAKKDACAAGSAPACRERATELEKAGDKESAARFYELACDFGDKSACSHKK